MSLRKEKIIDAPLADVWSAWTTSDGARTFFAPKARIDLAPGGAYELYFMPEAPEGTRGSEGCTVVEFEPEKTLSVTWNFPPTLPSIRNEHTRVTIDLEPIAQDRTQVTVTQEGFMDGPVWQQGRTYFDRAWTLVLERLQYRFTKGPLDWKNPYAPDGF